MYVQYIVSPIALMREGRGVSGRWHAGRG
eukprot:COSAG02_NODE_58277_length_278_cov_0.547486_1_plen_28_part_01